MESKTSQFKKLEQQNCVSQVPPQKSRKQTQGNPARNQSPVLHPSHKAVIKQGHGPGRQPAPRPASEGPEYHPTCFGCRCPGLTALRAQPRETLQPCKIFSITACSAISFPDSICHCAFWMQHQNGKYERESRRCV